MNFLRSPWFPVLLGVLIVIVIINELLSTSHVKENQAGTINNPAPESHGWHAPDVNSLPSTPAGDLIRYGRELISNTSKYLGPKGIVAPVTNGMNCQNCHLDAGTKPYSNCLSAVASVYPTYRPRSGIIESIEFRINDCLKRSLNGSPIDTSGKEMKAMVAYMRWVGKDIGHGEKPAGAGSEEIDFLNRGADTSKGKLVYEAKCQACHGRSGNGFLNADSSAFIYPPLWGENSYNTGAGLYRLSRFAGYVKNSMPMGASYEKPQLTNEEAWDVAAFVNSQPRPAKPFKNDWPDITKKAVDFPFGPYADVFPARQHKYGPFAPIKKAQQNVKSSLKKG